MSGSPGSSRPRSRSVALLLLAASLILDAGASERARPVRRAAPAFPPAVASSLQSALDDWAAQPRHRGVSAAVILANGAEWVSTAGIEAPGKPLEPDHLIWIASITKTMTGAVILSLVDERVLGLDDPISLWLPWRPDIDPDITIRQLLNHTNGLYNYTANPALGNAIAENPDHHFSAEELISYVGPRSFPPGARTEYTNTAFLLLGMIAEAATGKTITRLYHERIWDRSGLTEIYLPGPESPPGPVARAWAGTTASQSVDPREHMALLTIGNSAFGLFSNARTVARWGRILFAGDLLSPELRDAMLDFVPAAGNIPGESGAGLGIRKYAYLGREQWGHSGGATYGASLMLYDSSTGTTVAVIANQGGANADHFVLAPHLLDIATAPSP